MSRSNRTRSAVSAFRSARASRSPPGGSGVSGRLACRLRHGGRRGSGVGRVLAGLDGAVEVAVPARGRLRPRPVDPSHRRAQRRPVAGPGARLQVGGERAPDPLVLRPIRLDELGRGFSRRVRSEAPDEVLEDRRLPPLGRRAAEGSSRRVPAMKVVRMPGMPLGGELSAVNGVVGRSVIAIPLRASRSGLRPAPPEGAWGRPRAP